MALPWSLALSKISRPVALPSSTLGRRSDGNERRGLTHPLPFFWLEGDESVVSAEKVCELHAIASKKEALQWRSFCSWPVAISGTDYMPPQKRGLSPFSILQ
jgi:hypothetical protein